MISLKKIDIEKKNIIKKCKKCSGKGCPVCFGYVAYIDRMAQAEIPLDYWFREMEQFYGDQNFKGVITKYIGNLSKMYERGLSLCFVGHPGTGKTMAASCILKAAVLPSESSDSYFSAYYTTMIEATTKLMSRDAYWFRKMIKEYDFMVIDEVDPRFFPSDGSRDLHGNHFENILRARVQNRLPTIICTNSEDVGQIFNGDFKTTFESLTSQHMKIIRAGGKDVRKGEEKLCS